MCKFVFFWFYSFIYSVYFFSFLCVFYLQIIIKKTHSYQEEGTGIQTSCIIAFPAPAPLSLLGLLNIKHYCIISPYFYRFRTPISCPFSWGVPPYLRTYKTPPPPPTNGNGLEHYNYEVLHAVRIIKICFYHCNDKLVFVSE